MNGMLPFFGKELKELFYTHKVLMFAVLFLLLGMISPLTAKLLPDLLATMPMEGMTLLLSDVTYVDAYMQFFKNISSFAYFVLVIAFAGLINQEISKGTLALLCSKGLSRTTVFVTKYFTAALLWTIALILGIATQILYTYFLFDTHDAQLFLYGFISTWVFGLFLLAITILGSVLAKHMYSTLLFVGTIVVICLFLNIIPAVQAYNPLTIASVDVQGLANGMKPEYFYQPIAVSVLMILLSFAIGILYFRKKEL